MVGKSLFYGVSEVILSIKVTKTSNMDKYFYRKGDIVKLDNECLKSIDRKRFFSQNLFYFKDVDGLFAKVSSGDVDVKIPLRSILPVKIDGVEDRDIYYDPVVAANVVETDQEPPTIKRDKGEYYLNALKRSFNSEHISYYDIILSKNVNYVHEIQQQIPKLRYDLKIHYHITGLFADSKPLGRLGKLTLVTTAATYKKKQDDSCANITGKTLIYMKGEIKENEDVASPNAEKGVKYVVVCDDERLASYIAFLMNSPVGKLLLIKDFKNHKLNGTINVETIKKMPVYFIADFYESCICLQYIIDALKEILKKPGKIDVNGMETFIGFFDRLRGGLVLEMILPQYFQRRNLELLEPWKDEIDKLNGEVKDWKENTSKFVDFLSRLVQDMIAKGNKLMANMAKLRLYTNELLNVANKKIEEK